MPLSDVYNDEVLGVKEHHMGRYTKTITHLSSHGAKIISKGNRQTNKDEDIQPTTVTIEPCTLLSLQRYVKPIRKQKYIQAHIA